MRKNEVPIWSVFHDFSWSLKCSSSFILDICKTNPNATKSEALKRSTVWWGDITHSNTRKTTGIRPTSTVYISHLAFTICIIFDLLTSSGPPYMIILYWRNPSYNVKGINLSKIIAHLTTRIKENRICSYRVTKNPQHARTTGSPTLANSQQSPPSPSSP